MFCKKTKDNDEDDDEQKWKGGCRFFVVTNGLASVHNLVMIAVDVWGEKLDYNGLRLVTTTILDVVCQPPSYFFSFF